CTEVVEHFRDPITEWNRLINLVKKGGWLVIMTQLTYAELDFSQWYYKNDTTHICFYANQTFNWIAQQYFLSFECSGESVILLQC
ncbi:MAG: methyltransferase domain-containing protein, partial [SAR324 cluster bacterium]|nr:methyltransferase domain-containing protein [SAR324 cluster bacterium]